MATQAPWLRPRAAYVHIPFCAHHCGYCDFAVAVGHDAQMEEYLRCLRLELATLGEPQPVQTLFLGGGTPSHLPPRLLEGLLRDLHAWLPLESGGEFSIEANPDDLDPDRIDVLAAAGVNRVSLGVQSFAPAVLSVLERRHRPDDVAPAIERLRPRIANFSLDLIFGVPGQTLDGWHEDIERALAFGPAHLSTYGLTYEKGTRLWKQRERGEVRPLDEETELAFYMAAMDRLAPAGFEHYEISNHARPGQRCRHNLVYWANHAYFGFGVGAARYVDGVRELNTRDLATYLRRVGAGSAPTFQSERLEPRERALETVALQLRRSDGIERPSFREQTGLELDELVGAKIARLVELELLVDDGARVALTRRGKCVADAVLCELM